MDADECGIEGGVDRRPVPTDQLIDVTADEDRDRSRCDGVFEQDSGAGEVTAPRAERPPRKAVAAAGRGQRNARRRLCFTAGDDTGHQSR